MRRAPRMHTKPAAPPAKRARSASADLDAAQAREWATPYHVLIGFHKVVGVACAQVGTRQSIELMLLERARETLADCPAVAFPNKAPRAERRYERTLG